METRKADTSLIECCYVCDNVGSHYEGANVSCVLKHGTLYPCKAYLNHYFDVCDDFKRRTK